MAWVIGSNKHCHPRFQTLHWHLLLSYLTVMLAILLLSIAGVYEFFRRSLYEQLDQRLEILAQAASHSLMSIKQHYDQRHQLAGQQISNFSVLRTLDGDGDLDIPWQNLRIPDQSVEWFNPNGKLIGRAGTLPISLPLQPSIQILQQGHVRAITLAAYSYPHGKPHLEGYIRASQTTQELEDVLNRLRWGLGVGGIAVLGLTGLGGLWLTRQSLKPIERSFEQLKQFTADASHELRSPLTAIKTSVEVMQQYPERIHPQDVKKVSAIATAANQMTHLVEDLMFLARMDTATTTKTDDWQLLSLANILEDLLEMLELQAQEQEIKLQSHLLPDIWVRGDAKQLSRLFANLLENALQYTPTGGTVTLSMQRHYHSVVVSVEDTGIGIEPEQLKYVFDRFWRADPARSRREAGSGMGLAIAQAIAQRHNGEITASSKVGVGSCFRVRLPMV